VSASNGVVDQIYGYYGNGPRYQHVVIPTMGHEMTVAEVVKALDLMKTTWSK
jgi:hypothetical protein